MNKRMNLITERENPENREVNKKIKDILTGDSRRYTDIKKMGYDVNIDDSARKEFGKRYFGKNIEITNPKTGRKLYANVGKDYTPDTIIAKGDEERNSKWHKLSGHSGALHKGNKDKFDYKNFLDSPTPEREDNKLTTVQQYRKDKQFLKDMEYDAKRIDDARNRISNIRSKYNLKPQNESYLDVEDKAKEVYGPVYADAIRGIKRANKLKDEFTKMGEVPKREENPRLPQTVKGAKKLYLSESLFEEYDEPSDYLVIVYEDGESSIEGADQYTIDDMCAELEYMPDEELEQREIAGWARLYLDDDGYIRRSSSYAREDEFEELVKNTIRTYEHKVDESLNEDVNKINSTEDMLIQIVGDEYESGHILYDNIEQLKDDLINSFDFDFSNVDFDSLWDFYLELRDLGPEGFYEEYKDQYEFSDDFKAEYGLNDFDESLF